MLIICKIFNKFLKKSLRSYLKRYLKSFFNDFLKFFSNYLLPRITLPSKLQIYTSGISALISFKILLSFSYFLPTNIPSIKFDGIPNKIADSLSVKKSSLFFLCLINFS